MERKNRLRNEKALRTRNRRFLPVQKRKDIGRGSRLNSKYGHRKQAMAAAVERYDYQEQQPPGCRRCVALLRTAVVRLFIEA